MKFENFIYLLALECQIWYYDKLSFKIQYLLHLKCKTYEINFIQFQLILAWKFLGHVVDIWGHKL
jgi:hypothetical protein